MELCSFFYTLLVPAWPDQCHYLNPKWLPAKPKVQLFSIRDWRKRVVEGRRAWSSPQLPKLSHPTSLSHLLPVTCSRIKLRNKGRAATGPCESLHLRLAYTGSPTWFLYSVYVWTLFHCPIPNANSKCKKKKPKTHAKKLIPFFSTKARTCQLQCNNTSTSVQQYNFSATIQLQCKGLPTTQQTSMQQNNNHFRSITTSD